MSQPSQKIVCMWCWKEPERIYFIKGYSYCRECAQIEFNMSSSDGKGDIKVDELDVEMDKVRKREYL